MNGIDGNGTTFTSRFSFDILRLPGPFGGPEWPAQEDSMVSGKRSSIIKSEAIDVGQERIILLSAYKIKVSPSSC